MKDFFTAFGVGVAIIIVCYFLSWLITCGIIKLITLCFGWSFKWSLATGIWLIMCLLQGIFSHHTTIKK